MSKFLEKCSVLTPFLLVIALFAALFFYPTSLQMLSIAIIIFTIGTAILFTISHNWENKKRSELSNSEFARNTFLDLVGLTLTIGAAIWLGRLAGNYVGQIWGLIAGIIIAMLVGLGVAFLVGKIWGRINQPLLASAK